MNYESAMFKIYYFIIHFNCTKDFLSDECDNLNFVTFAFFFLFKKAIFIFLTTLKVYTSIYFFAVRGNEVNSFHLMYSKYVVSI